MYARVCLVPDEKMEEDGTAQRHTLHKYIKSVQNYAKIGIHIYELTLITFIKIY